MNTPHNWLGGLALAAVILAGTVQTQGPDDLAAEQAMADTLQDARTAAIAAQHEATAAEAGPVAAPATALLAANTR